MSGSARRVLAGGGRRAGSGAPRRAAAAARISRASRAAAEAPVTAPGFLPATGQRPAQAFPVTAFYRSYRLDRFLQAMIPKISRARIQNAIRTRVTVSWHSRPRCSTPVQPGGEVVIYFPLIVEPEVPGPTPVLFEDGTLLVANKPAGLLVHPTHSCLRNNLIHLLRAERPGIPLALAHRLDRDTSGAILLTKSPGAARFVARQFQNRTVEKTYLAVVLGRVSADSGRIDAPLGVSRSLQVVFRRSVGGEDTQAAVTDFRVLARGEDISLLALRPHTGRRHQLRAHLAALGHPIAGDRLYALPAREFLRHLRGDPDGPGAPATLLAGRQLLHAFRLRLRHPGSGAWVSFEAPLPADILACLAARDVATPATIPPFEQPPVRSATATG